MEPLQNQPTLQESLSKVIPFLPPPVKNYLASGKYSPVAARLMSKYGLHVDQGGILERELMLLLIGAETSEGFASTLKDEARLSENVVSAIISDINQEIFTPLRTEMEKGSADRAQPLAPRPQVQMQRREPPRQAPQGAPRMPITNPERELPVGEPQQMQRPAAPRPSMPLPPTSAPLPPKTVLPRRDVPAQRPPPPAPPLPQRPTPPPTPQAPQSSPSQPLWQAGGAIRPPVSTPPPPRQMPPPLMQPARPPAPPSMPRPNNMGVPPPPNLPGVSMQPPRAATPPPPPAATAPAPPAPPIYDADPYREPVD